ncbi:polysaccharide biosynthesis/export family protein [Paraburkholderia nemoris]|uniref:polysaccharide biosynthesis/export family protein n=1 Tax=Paraburkholderia nemoris TaxID=2793076 RepID=UPI0038B8016C
MNDQHTTLTSGKFQFAWQCARRTLATTLCVAVAACAVAPGMQMRQPAELQISAGNNSTPAVNEQIPVTNIDLALISKLRAQATTSDSKEDQSLLDNSGPYALGPGDVLQIIVWDHPEIAAAVGAQPQNSTRPSDPVFGFVIDQAGDLQFPYVGSIHVAGLRPDQAKELLSKELGKTLRSPQITLRVGSYRSQQIYVDGEVRTPGVQPINDIQMSVYEAISRAGGFSPNADQSRVTLIRNGQTYVINFTAMLNRGQNPSDIILKNKDVLRVVARADNPVYVMGEVNKPASAIPMTNGKLSLSDALAQAGSLNTGTADAAQIYVIRNSLASQPELYHLNAHSPVAMILANQFDLRASDIVYVDGNGLVRFSRVLSLLLPAINAGLTAAVVTK